MATPALAALSPLDALANEIRDFVASCREPHLLELGEPCIPLSAEGDSCNWSLQRSGGWLLLEAWDRDQFLSRKVRKLGERSRVRLSLITERLGGKDGGILLYDAFRPSNTGLQQKGRRLVFGERFRHMMQREFPGAKVERFHTDADLENSLSPAYPRAVLRVSGGQLATIAAPPGSDVDGVLSFGLIWLDYLRRTMPKAKPKARLQPNVKGLALFVPSERERTTCLRVAHLDPARAAYQVFAYDESDCTSALDLSDTGNLDTHLPAVPGLARADRLEPEAVIEQLLRTQIQTLDARLCPEPVYGQVPNFAGQDRGILDLLAIDYTGRLTVIELKATESVHLPLQALDYWLRVKWHLQQNDFPQHGYFPGMAIVNAAPRLILAAPALRFHPSNERTLAYLSREIEVQRIGLAEGTGDIRVLFRH